MVVIVAVTVLVARRRERRRLRKVPITFSEHVAPIVFANCTSCHRPGEAAPFSLMSYRDARPLAKAIASATASHAMPPWKAGPSDYPFANARQLTGDQIATIQRWVADGALEGDPARMPPLPRFTEGLAARSSGPDGGDGARRLKCRRAVPMSIATSSCR